MVSSYGQQSHMPPLLTSPPVQIQEYATLKAGLEECKSMGIRRLMVKGDALLIVRQVQGTWACKNSKLLQWLHEVKLLMKDFEAIQIQHISRQHNKEADNMANTQFEVMVGAIKFKEPLFQGQETMEDILYFLETGECPKHLERIQWHRLVRKALSYQLIGEHLYHKGKDLVLRRVPLVKKIEKILMSCHDGVCGGHFAQEITSRKILQAGFVWPSLHRDVQHWCKACKACQQAGDRKLSYGPRFLIFAYGPFEKWGIDAIGPLPRTSTDKQYILTATDYMTRWAEAASVARITAADVSKFVFDYICSRFGTPLEILSDRGPGFRADLLDALLENLSIKHVHSTPYYPQCNGLVEKTNGVLCKVITKHVRDRPQDWDKHLTAALWAYRTSFKVSTKFTPYHLVYGQEALLPIEVELGSLRVLARETTSSKEKLEQRILDLQRLELDRETTTDYYITQANKKREQFNNKVKEKKLEEGMLVMSDTLDLIQSLYLGVGPSGGHLPVQSSAPETYMVSYPPTPLIDYQSPRLTVSVLGKKFSGVIVDGGSGINMMPEFTMLTLGLQPTRPAPCTVTLANQRTIYPLGIVEKVAFPSLFELDFIMVRLPQVEGGFPLLISRPWLRHTKALHDWGSSSMWISNANGSRQSIKLEEGIDPSITQSALAIQSASDIPPPHSSDNELLEWLATIKGIICYGITVQQPCGKPEPDGQFSPSIQISKSTKASQSSEQMSSRKFLLIMAEVKPSLVSTSSQGSSVREYKNTTGVPSICFPELAGPSFGVAHSIQSLVQGESQTIEDFVKEFNELWTKWYISLGVEIPPSMLKKDRFLASLRSGLCLKVELKQPRTFEEVVELAKNKEWKSQRLSQLGFNIEPNIEVKVVEQPKILTKDLGHDQQVAHDVDTSQKEMQEVVGLMNNFSVHMMGGGRSQGYGYGRGYGSNEGFAGARGKCYILTAIDYLSRWAEAKPVKQITSKDVAKFVYEDICCKFGMPLELLSNKGPGFRGELVDYLCEKFHVRRRFPNGTYQLADLNGTLHKARVNGYRLRKYYAKLMVVIEDQLSFEESANMVADHEEKMKTSSFSLQALVITTLDHE
ncbi:hypothetical protein L7F22_060329 [Adiantum nelumboides]|nr:hypothetical protein [Adiantum nelumboides]